MSLSGGREIPLTREIEDLKSKLMTKTDELDEAIKRKSEVLYPAYNLLSLLKCDYYNNMYYFMQLSSQLMFTAHKLEELRREGLERLKCMCIISFIIHSSCLSEKIC